MRVLVVGLGGIAQRHLKALKALRPSAEVAALRRQGHLPENGVERIFSGWEAAAAFSPDFALVCSPTSLHLEDARRLAELNVPFLMEKPVASGENGLPEFCALLEGKKLLTHVGCQLRFDPMLGHVKDALEQGSCGRSQRVRVFCHSYLPSWRPRDYRTLYSARRELGGGVALDLIHEIDTLLWWFGEPLKVYGVRAKVSSLEISVDDQCSAVLLYPGLVAEVSLSYGEKFQRRGFEIAFEDGLLTGDLLSGRLVFLRGEGEQVWEKVFERNREGLFLKQMEHFLSCLEERRASKNSFREGARAVEVVSRLETILA